MIRCIAYSDVLGRICGQPAYILDKQRAGMVCAEHAPVLPARGNGPSLEEAVVDLAIALQAREIDIRLAHLHAFEVEKKVLAGPANIFLSESGRCLPTAISAGLAAASPGECESAREASVPLASNPNAAAFDQVHVFRGGRWP